MSKPLEAPGWPDLQTVTAYGRAGMAAEESHAESPLARADLPL